MALGLGKSKAAEYAKELQRTSSLKKCAICDLCGKRETKKLNLIEHLKVCTANRTCTWCNIVFKNRGNLFTHTLYIHGKKTRETPNIKKISPASFACTVCPKSYTQVTNLKYHIRREHFNMIAKIIEGENRKLNEVWLERVLNSDAVVEIKKAKHNMYLMKKASTTDSLEISEPKDSIDLSHLYPTHVRRHRIWCDLCKKTYYQRDFQKHVNEKHEKLRPHQCNNCNRTFNRPYQYLQHSCLTKRQWRRNPSTKQLGGEVTVED